jgi:hypothetical protein
MAKAARGGKGRKKSRGEKKRREKGTRKVGKQQVDATRPKARVVLLERATREGKWEGHV